QDACCVKPCSGTGAGWVASTGGIHAARSEAATTQNPCKLDGACGTRTRHLRLAKPDSSFPDSSGRGGDSLREQAFHPWPCGDRRAPPAPFADLMQDASEIGLLAEKRTTLGPEPVLR